MSRPIVITAAHMIADLQQRGIALNDLHDMYIAATAHTERLPVLTANIDHFERIEEVQVINWHEF